jgi:DNA (cytosine-5)-methyltransferase 1
VNERTHLDLFSGIGGFALAARWAGFRTIGFCEIDPYCQRVLAKNFHCDTNINGKSDVSIDAEVAELPRIYGDIFTLNGRDFAGVDLITGGFPCQPFSCAGKRRGKKDYRHLWPEMLRVISEAGPAWVVGENVAGIINMELDTVLSDLESIGYACRPFVIPACGVDAPHRRNRVWIVAHAGRLRDGENQPESIAGGGIPTDIGFSSEVVADADESRSQGHGGLRERGTKWAPGPCRWPDESEWFAQSGMGRVAHGIPKRVDRLRGLGNAIVPQVAYQIIRAMNI